MAEYFECLRRWRARRSIRSAIFCFMTSEPEISSCRTVGQSRERVRTAPLWGVRTRTNLMHDGETLTFNEAILRHAGEATQVRNRYIALSPADKRKLITYLESL